MRQKLKKRLAQIMSILLAAVVIAAFTPQMSDSAYAYDADNPRIEGDEIVVYVTIKAIGGGLSYAGVYQGTSKRVIRLSRKIDEDKALVIEDGICDGGGFPFYGYKNKGKWSQKPHDTYEEINGPMPTKDKNFEQDTTYTYTYERNNIEFPSVTFKVRNGSWNDGTKTSKTVKLTHSNFKGATLVSSEIPAVGGKPAAGFKAGSWDVKPSTKTGLRKDKTYIYSYVKKPPQKKAGPLLAKLRSKGKKTLVITWNKIKGAKGYDVFFIKCGKKAPVKVRSFKGNKTFRWTKKGLKKKTPYKAVVRAYVLKKGKKTYIRTSPMVHAYTSGGTDKRTNAKSVTVNKKAVSLKAGKTFRIKAAVSKLRKGKKLMASEHAPKLRYLSSNKKIVTVSKSGKITAKAKGSCKIYAIAVNGVRAAVTVRVR